MQSNSDICSAQEITMKHLFILLLLGFGLSSCFRDGLTEPDPWEPKFNLPVLKTSLSLEDLTNVQDIQGSATIASTAINPLWTGTTFVPPVAGLSNEDNPAEFEISEYFSEIYTDSLIIGVEFVNDYPIAFSRGSKLVFRNSVSGDIVEEHSLVENVNPKDTYRFDIRIIADAGNPTRLESKMDFYLDDFRSNGSGLSQVNFDNAATKFIFKLEFLRINRILLEGEQKFTDTLVTEITLDEGDTLDPQRLAEGSIDLYIDNGLPVNLKTQIDMLDENDKFIEGFFQDTVILPPATIDQATGDVSNRQEVKIVVPMSFQKVDYFYDKIKLKTTYNINTVGLGGANGILLSRKSDIKVQVVLNLDAYPENLD